MLRLITSQDAVRGHEEVLGMIYGGTIDSTSTWVETSALLVTEIQGRPYGRYFVVVLTNDSSEDDRDELDRLQVELGRPLPECVVEREAFRSPHAFFPGSTSFYMITLYGG